MDIQQLTYFSALCETLNYTTAARKCFITRQGIRQAIQAIEKEYGVPLVENHKNHLKLTPAGELLYEKSSRVLRAFRDMERSMYEYLSSEEPLRIGISRSLIPFYAPEITERAEQFSNEYSALHTEIQLLPADQIIEMLRDGTLDGGILVDLEDHDLPCTRTVLRKDAMTILMSSSHRLARKSALKLEDLAGETIMIMSEPSDCFSLFYHALNAHQIPVAYRVVPDYYEVGYQVLNTDCIAIDRTNAEPPRKNHLECNLELENGAFTLCCSLLIRSNASRNMEIFRKFLLSAH